MGGHVSGAHYNPDASLGFLLLGAMQAGELIRYRAIQVAGAVGGAALAAEFLFTFMLVLVIANVALRRATCGNGYFGIAIGLTVAAAVFRLQERPA